MLFSIFTGSRPATLLADNDSSCKDSEENSTNNLFSSTLVYNSDEDILINNKPDLKTRTTKLETIYYGDINFFLLRNPDNPKRDILIVEVDFRNLKGRSEGIDG
jgi:hypothetical protein